MRLSWLGIACLVLMSAPAWSQEPSGTTPPGMTVAPSAPNQKPEMPQGQAGAGQPANICKELVAFLEQQAAKKAETAQGGQAPAATAAQPSGQPPAPNAPQPQSAGQAAAQGGERVQQSSGQSAPIPQAGTTQGPTIAIEQAQTWASSNDLKGCQDGVRRLRRAGIAMPPGLLALAALRPELIEKMKPN